MVIPYSAYRPTALEYCDEEEENELCDNISCPPIEDPICGKDSKNETEYFANSCILDNYNCKNDDGKQTWNNTFFQNK